MMTGAEAAALVIGRERVRVTRGRDCYQPETRMLFLSWETWHGTGAGAIYRALHEAAHARQHIERPLWFSQRHVPLLRLRIERDAWRRAELWMREMGLDPQGASVEKELGLASYAGGGTRHFWL